MIFVTIICFIFAVKVFSILFSLFINKNSILYNTKLYFYSGLLFYIPVESRRIWKENAPTLSTPPPGPTIY